MQAVKKYTFISLKLSCPAQTYEYLQIISALILLLNIKPQFTITVY